MRRDKEGEAVFSSSLYFLTNVKHFSPSPLLFVFLNCAGFIFPSSSFQSEAAPTHERMSSRAPLDYLSTCLIEKEKTFLFIWGGYFVFDLFN